MRKQWLWTIAVLVIVLGAIFGGKSYANHRAAVAAAHQSYPPASVSTAVARAAPWSSEVNVVGSLEAVSGTEITAQIAGNVTRIAFQSGARVKQGQLLVQLDDTTQLAQLHADQSKLELARTALARSRKLYASHAASQSDLQAAMANYGTARAAVEGDEAMLKKLHIVAPFSGVLGIREVSLGQYVSPGTTIVSLQSYDPLLLNFSVPQSNLTEIALGRTVAFVVNAYAGKPFPGRVTAIGSRVDPTTRNVDVQATLDNAKGLLRPGMFGNVTLSTGATDQGIVVPNTAIAYSTFGDSVYVVKQNAGHQAVAHQQVVQVAQERGGLALVASGLASGDIVVTAGQNKLSEGAPVSINNSITP